MNHSLTRHRFRIGSTAFFVMLASGCATSPPSRFYTLSSINPKESTAPSGDHAVLVAVGPVTIPDYVDRPEIITTDGPNAFKVHDFDHWAGSLGRNLSSVLVEDLTASLPADKYIIGRWNPSLGLNVTTANRVVVDVTRFDFSPGPGGSAVFVADWVLYGPNANALTIKKFRGNIPVQGTDFNAMTAAMSQCVVEFSSEVARAITAVHDKINTH